MSSPRISTLGSRVKASSRGRSIAATMVSREPAYTLSSIDRMTHAGTSFLSEKTSTSSSYADGSTLALANSIAVSTS